MRQISCLKAAITSIFVIWNLSAALPLSWAQTITLLPLSITVKDGEDFFTDVWAKPKDFSDICDVGNNHYFYNPQSAADGAWTAISPAMSAPYFSPVPLPTVGTPAVYREDCSKQGVHYPIDAGKYTYLSYKMKVSKPGVQSLLWASSGAFVKNSIWAADGYDLPGLHLPTKANVWTIKSFDLPALASPAVPWSGSIKGLTVWPSSELPPGGITAFDWMRLIDPATSPKVQLTWKVSGQAGWQDSVALYVDSDAAGHNGTVLARGLPLQGSKQLLTAAFPPGKHYFYTTIETHNGQAASTKAFSPYAGPLTINGKPVLQFTSPTRTSGREYSRDERGNAWDMSDASDVCNLQYSSPLFRGFHDYSFSNGYFYATSDNSAAAVVDTQVHLTVPAGKPIDTSLYRYFCYRLQIDSSAIARNGDPAALSAAGRFARLMYADAGITWLGSTGGADVIEKSAAFPDLQNGLTTYCFDLWDDSIVSDGPAWRSHPAAGFIRFDPMEAYSPTKFVIDFAALYAENRTNSDSQFAIGFNASDPEGQPLNVALYYDTDRAGANGTEIGVMENIAPGTRTYVWDAKNVPPGLYYIYAAASDGLNTAIFYSEVPVRVLQGAGEGQPAPQTAAPCDYNGDGKTDYTVVRRNNAAKVNTWFSSFSDNSPVRIRNWGVPGLDYLMDADVNGDRQSDETAVRKAPAISWFSMLSGSSAADTAAWGVAGDIPLATDIDGDRVTDRSVFRPADGTWWTIGSSEAVATRFWGLYGDIPAPEDYDGDGRDDYAVWRPSIGYWAVLFSGHNYDTQLSNIVWRQWGLPGDVPMSGDYTGDGKADLVVWRPGDGTWYICSSESEFSCGQPQIVQFGLPGDFPIRGDFDGDGVLDPAVWRPAFGNWYVRRSSDGVVSVKQWGLPGDFPLCTGVLGTMSLVP